MSRVRSDVSRRSSLSPQTAFLAAAALWFERTQCRVQHLFFGVFVPLKLGVDQVHRAEAVAAGGWACAGTNGRAGRLAGEAVDAGRRALRRGRCTRLMPGRRRVSTPSASPAASGGRDLHLLVLPAPRAPAPAPRAPAPPAPLAPPAPPAPPAHPAPPAPAYSACLQLLLLLLRLLVLLVPRPPRPPHLPHISLLHIDPVVDVLTLVVCLISSALCSLPSSLPSSLPICLL